MCQLGPVFNALFTLFGAHTSILRVPMNEIFRTIRWDISFFTIHNQFSYEFWRFILGEYQSLSFHSLNRSVCDEYNSKFLEMRKISFRIEYIQLKMGFSKANFYPHCTSLDTIIPSACDIWIIVRTIRFCLQHNHLRCYNRKIPTNIQEVTFYYLYSMLVFNVALKKSYA